MFFLPTRGPLYKHLKDAISLNRARMPLYSKLTEGKSENLSRRLIASEMFSLPFALVLDGMTAPYRAAGIKIGDVEYIDMKDVPAFQNQYPFSPEPLSQFKVFDPTELKAKIRENWQNLDQQAGFLKLADIAEHTLVDLDKLKAYHCMVKHLLESFIRAARLAPLHHQKCIERKMQSTLSISKKILWGHLPALQPGSDLDRDLAPIQAVGIPMLWQDVPKISVQVRAEEIY